nr:uncharacterized protein CI109_007122 [Kwoniella shandongensis]KAA5524522.1 hypothetical protein CI109_007122 [Kwoniella shandongensis]
MASSSHNKKPSKSVQDSKYGADFVNVVGLELSPTGTRARDWPSPTGDGSYKPIGGYGTMTTSSGGQASSGYHSHAPPSATAASGNRSEDHDRCNRWRAADWENAHPSDPLLGTDGNNNGQGQGGSSSCFSGCGPFYRK